MRYLIIALFIVVIACDSAQDANVVARVNDTYLLDDDIADLITENTTAADSVSVVSSYVTSWATERLFLDRAEENLTEGQKNTLNKLVSEYKNSLYMKIYKDALVAKTLDTVITDQELEGYYEQNKANFNLNKELVKLRYIHLDNSFAEKAATRRSFNRYNEEDQHQINDMKFAYKASSLNDSIWVEFDQIIRKVPVLRTKNRKEVLKNKGLLQLKDSLGVYLIKIEEVLYRNDAAPLSYVRPMIREIIHNKRKLELIKKLEKDITKDAIKNEQFEIYN